jgi:putative CocE/NonD family hydrolase
MQNVGEFLSNLHHIARSGAEEQMAEANLNLTVSRRLTVLFLFFGSLALCSPLRADSSAYQFGNCANQSAPSYADVTVQSVYVAMRDGVRIAVDIALPKTLPPRTKIPALLQMTRYWRTREGDGPTNFERFWTSRGYATVVGDSRGTGASFGIWRYHRNPDETRDFREIVDWIQSQPWSNGHVGAIGLSYSANTADWIAENKHPAVNAIIAKFPDFDPYTELYFPGGIFHTSFGKTWSDKVRNLDLDVASGIPPKGVKPVDADTDGRLLHQAIQERLNIADVYEGLKQITFRDDAPTTWGASMNDWSISTHLEQLQDSRVAMYTWGSWFDSGVAAGVLERFSTLTNPQRAIIGAWSHGARSQANPYQDGLTPPNPGPEFQELEDVCFFDSHLKGVKNGMSERLLVYYTVGEDKWKTTQSWPPPNSTSQRWYLISRHTLSRKRPGVSTGRDQYKVDFEATTGLSNRWHTQTGGQPVSYPDRVEADRRLLVYTSLPLHQDTEITGTAVIKLFLTTTASDGAVFAYLEDVAEDGRVSYLTEGELRALHRKTPNEQPPYKTFSPYHSFMRKDAAPVVPGELMELNFGLLPVSVLVKKGHRLRVAIAGADRDTFVRIPAEDDPVLSVFRNAKRASFVDIPVVLRH